MNEATDELIRGFIAYAYRPVKQSSPTFMGMEDTVMAFCYRLNLLDGYVRVDAKTASWAMPHLKQLVFVEEMRMLGEDYEQYERVPGRVDELIDAYYFQHKLRLLHQTISE